MMFPLSHGIFGATQPGPVPVDKAALLAALAAAAALEEADYTPESWQDVEDAVAAGEDIVADPNATQQQVDDAAQAITDAIAALVPAVPEADKTALLAALSDAAALDEGDYTPESWAVLDGAVTAGQLVYDDPDATQQQVDDATSAISTAIAALVPVAASCVVALTHDVLAIDPSYLPADIDGQVFSITSPTTTGDYAASTALADLKPLPASGIMWVAFRKDADDQCAFQIADAATLTTITFVPQGGDEWWVFYLGTATTVSFEYSGQAVMVGIGSDGTVYAMLDDASVVSVADMAPVAGTMPEFPLAGATGLAFVGVVRGNDAAAGTASAEFITRAEGLPQLPGGEGYDWCGNPLPVPAGELVAIPLTYDVSTVGDNLAWTLDGDGPNVTPLGFMGNGYDARAYAPILPWMAGADSPLTLHASVRAIQGQRDPNRSRIVTIANPSQPKLQLVVVTDPHDQEHFQIAANWHDGALQSLNLGRRDWRYELRYPELEAGGFNALPQGLKFVDADTLLIAAHYDYQFSLCHRIRLSDKTVTGRFIFETEDGTVVAPKNGAISQRPSDGSYWFSDNTNKVLYEIDIDASFASGFMVVTNTLDCTAVSSTAAICWIESGGSEYLLIGEYASSAAAYLYVIPGSVVGSNSVFSLGDRYKRFAMPKKTQGLVMRDGLLFVSSNNPEAGSTFNGRMYTVDIHQAIANAADGSALVPIQYFYAAGGCPEDIDVHPVTGDIWMPTEGDTAIGAGNGYRGIWSSPVSGVIPDGSPQENHYTLTYSGTDTLDVRVNNQMFESIQTAIIAAPETISIGGHAAAVPGQESGYYIGYVRGIVVADRPLTQQEYYSATTGAYESRSLASYPVPMVNPGAEDDVNGWTMEIGGMDTRSSDPPPHTGLAYFNGGPHAQTIGSQRHSLTAFTGLTGQQIDDGGLSVMLEWWQAAWDNASGTATDEDKAAIGVRFLDADQIEISQSYGALIRVEPRLWWLKRSSAAAVPVGTRYIDILYRADRDSGTNNDGRIDDIAATVYARDGGQPAPDPDPQPGLPTEIGQAFGGGFYIGDITVADGGPDDGTYAVIMAGPEGEVSLRWKTAGSATPGTLSSTNGLANTLAMDAAGISAHPAGQHCLSYASGGIADFYMPSLQEWVLVRNSKSLLAVLGLSNSVYWSSTERNSSQAETYNYGNDFLWTANKATAQLVRPVRRIRKS